MHDLLADYLRHLAFEKHSSGHTVKSYREDLTQAVKYFEGQLGGRALTPACQKGIRAMKEYCYVVLNNAGHSWAMLRSAEANAPLEPVAPILPLLLQDGWLPVRETPMGGGTSALAHSLILLERSDTGKASAKPPGRRKVRA